ncbi:hypothetical protein D8B26_007292 [Coccidioides posadasii str. Silveira]|uniref:Uracil DNA glycosylase n=2 Tax=Coccidioides posadasii TaxID=199306 RepID=E9D3C6_COCPS|nr:mismatch-specific thymine-DNA glycosylate family protein [Coccidioides posadasii C735 delta SOWgp]EER30013.1 mismatch-specific thymine-DNA glycosylate family protein [Coccidioides posadasii C735 delta SOWgp]EFW19121.1 uracil DNA glycosylase [Coccidioides posadasii str. Silveira]QVM12674.1 hypothetical protein D8B26_007292 [Coccidioides posadasii str. Silveira]|eukprot:XP_003072158.1 mismatch-specific thymine-DNA glycosylate family protein [Coccidioides posadasii C735 delta SOWgp]
MPNEDISSSAPLTSFNGVLDKYVHISPSKNGRAEQQPASPTKRSSPLKRKLEDAGSEPGGDVASLLSEPFSRPPISPTRRMTRSQSAQTLERPCRPSPTKRTRSFKSAPPASDLATPSGPISLLHDTIPQGLILLFIGVNPGIMTGQTGFVYAHPSNLYWKLLHWSGITIRQHPPSDTYRLPELYGVGNTNIVARPTRDASMLSKAEMDAGVPVLEEKVRRNRPEAVCLVGKSIWEAIWRVRKGKNIKKEEFRYGWQDESENMGVIKPGEGDNEEWKGARVFVATTTSGLAATMSLAEKKAVWNELGAWVKQKRVERHFVPNGN